MFLDLEECEITQSHVLTVACIYRRLQGTLVLEGRGKQLERPMVVLPPGGATALIYIYIYIYTCVCMHVYDTTLAHGTIV